METRTILVCFQQGARADRELEESLEKELFRYDISPRFIYRTTMKGITEYLFSQAGASCSHVLISSEIVGDDGKAVKFSPEDIMELTDRRNLHIAAILPGSFIRDKEFLILLYLSGITSVVFEKKKKGPVAGEVARCLMEGRTRRECRELCRIGVRNMQVRALSYEQYVHWYDFLLSDDGEELSGRLSYLYRKLGLYRTVCFFSKLPDDVLSWLSTQGGFLEFMETLKGIGVRFVPAAEEASPQTAGADTQEDSFWEQEEPTGDDRADRRTPAPVTGYGTSHGSAFSSLFGWLFEEDVEEEEEKSSEHLPVHSRKRMPSFFENGPSGIPEETGSGQRVLSSYDEMMEKLAKELCIN